MQALQCTPCGARCIFFRATRIYRMPDVKRNAIIYLAVSSKIIEGSPANAISVVPIMPWPATMTGRSGAASSSPAE